MIGNEAPATSVHCLPKNTSALSIAPHRASALTLMSARGGTIERYLFDEENEGYLADRAPLDRLVTERSTSLVADLQAQGWAWAEVHLENDHWEALEKYTTLRLVPVDLDPARSLKPISCEP